VPLFRSAVRDPNGVVKHSFRMTWQAPANLLLHVTARDADLPEEADESHVTAHLLTPETEFSTHYFVLGARSWDTHNKALNETITDALMAAFTLEDKPMLQSVQESMGAVTDLWSLEPVILPCDPGPVHARRTLARMIKAEREAAASMGRMKTE
jgi:vanillate O-demethylase monooxygenase subunit